MRHEHVELFETALVEQLFQALAGGVLALLVLLLDPFRAAAGTRLLSQIGHIQQLAFDAHGASTNIAMFKYHKTTREATNFRRIH